METIDSRIQSLEMITDEEWKNMVQMEEDRLTEEETKASKSKKKDKEPKPFSNLEKVIKSLNLDAQNEQESLRQLDKVKKSYDDLVHTVQDSRNNFSQIIRDRNSTRTELESVGNWNNEIKKDAYFNLVDLHKKLSGNVPDENWTKVSKEFSRIIK
jgi:intergrase/recombinase